MKRAMRLGRDLAYAVRRVVCSLLIENGREDEAETFYEPSLAEPPSFSGAG